MIVQLVTLVLILFLIIVTVSWTPDLFGMDSQTEYCKDALLYARASSVLTILIEFAGLALEAQSLLDFYYLYLSSVPYAQSP